MPYSGVSDDKLPDRVKKMPANLRKLWVGAFNGIYKNKKDEGAAMAGANKMVNTARASSEDKDFSDEEIDTLVAQELESRPSRVYLQRLRDRLFGLKGQKIDDAMINNIVKSSAGYAGSQRRQEMTRQASDLIDYQVLYSLADKAPGSIQVLPIPGTYKHPTYGTIKITKARNQHFIDTFGTYQDKLPIDAEHNSKLSGAFGWMTDLKMNTDGSVDAEVEWTDRGEKAISEGRFKYFSPEWYESWTDPITEEKHSDVLIGGALTTRPFFKDDVLKPLIASELELDEDWEEEEEFAEIPNDLSFDQLREFLYQGLRKQYPTDGQSLGYYITDIFPNSMIYCDPKGKHFRVPYSVSDEGEVEVDFKLPKEVVRMTMWKSMTEQEEEEENKATQPDAGDVHVNSALKGKRQVDEKEFTEKLGVLEGQLTELKTATETATTQLTEERSKREAAEERVKGLETSLRHQRFVDIVKNGPHRWYGEVDKNVARLEKFAEVYGEDSDEFKDIVTEEQARAEQLSKSDLFKEVGTSQQAPTGKSAEFQQALQQYKEENKDKTDAEAITAVLAEHPEFYAEYTRRMNESSARGDKDIVKI